MLRAGKIGAGAIPLGVLGLRLQSRQDTIIGRIGVEKLSDQILSQTVAMSASREHQVQKFTCPSEEATVVRNPTACAHRYVFEEGRWTEREQKLAAPSLVRVALNGRFLQEAYDRREIIETIKAFAKVAEVCSL
ncbi:hypothetical protein D3C87_1764550 [compost metagenome]